MGAVLYVIIVLAGTFATLAYVQRTGHRISGPYFFGSLLCWPLVLFIAFQSARKCPYCVKRIHALAILCPYCHKDVARWVKVKAYSK